jgi:CBS domain containing-hemolysin-like protein
MVLGSTGLDDVSHALDMELTSENYDTISGYCLDHLDHLPEKNEIILTDNGLLLRIDRVDRNRIERVYIKLPRKDQSDES